MDLEVFSLHDNPFLSDAIADGPATPAARPHERGAELQVGARRVARRRRCLALQEQAQLRDQRRQNLKLEKHVAFTVIATGRRLRERRDGQRQAAFPAIPATDPPSVSFVKHEDRLAALPDFPNPIFLVAVTGSCHKRQKPQAPTPQAPIRNRQKEKSQTP